MLLERCRPGAELRGRPEAEQHVVVTDLLRSVWAVDLPSDHPFRPLSVMADDWVARAEARLAADPRRLDAGLAREGLALFRELSRTGPPDVLLFTDLHAGNVLSGERRPWLLIDPKPYVGDPHYDVLQHLLNCNESLQADPIGLLTEVADLAHLDAERVRQWLFARCVQESLGEGPPLAGARRGAAPAGWSVGTDGDRGWLSVGIVPVNLGSPAWRLVAVPVTGSSGERRLPVVCGEVGHHDLHGDVWQGGGKSFEPIAFRCPTTIRS